MNKILIFIEKDVFEWYGKIFNLGIDFDDKVEN